MTVRATFTIDDEAHAFLMKISGENRSAYINQLLIREKQRVLEAAILKANREEADDPDYQNELAVWCDSYPRKRSR